MSILPLPFESSGTDGSSGCAKEPSDPTGAAECGVNGVRSPAGGGTIQYNNGGRGESAWAYAPWSPVPDIEIFLRGL